MIIDFDERRRMDMIMQAARKQLAKDKSYGAALMLQKARRELNRMANERRSSFKALDGHLAELDALWNDEMREYDATEQ